jgi:serine phosphatase RsbU (regulator of sigma subunit)
VSATSDELRSTDPLAWLLQTSHDLPPPDLAGAVSEAMAEMGASASCVYLADHDQHFLHPFGPYAADRERLDVDGTTGGHAFVLETRLVVDTDDGARLWLPLIDGTARIGVVVVELADPLPDDSVVSGLERLASLAAELFVSKGHYTDAFEVVRRRKPMALQAELQRSILPPVALVTPQVAVAGMLLPAYEVAGDSFDYALNADHLDVAVIDSVGHDLHSSLISHVVQGSLRNSRRNGVDLVGAYAEADEALLRVFTDLRFATAAFGQLELATGQFRWVSAGHPPPLLVRGLKVVGDVATVPAMPLGLGGAPPVVNEVVLEPGDSVLLFTDGVIEGRASGGERFGVDRLADLLGRVLLADLPPAEMVRRVATAVLEHSAQELTDDTTLLFVRYAGR